MVPRRVIDAFMIRLRRALANNEVELTLKADDELIEMGWEPSGALAVLAELTADDLLHCEDSVRFPSLIWVFDPRDLFGRRLWIRLIERPHMILISFHYG